MIENLPEKVIYKIEQSKKLSHAIEADNLISVYLDAFIDVEDLEGTVTHIYVNNRFLYGIRKCIFSLKDDLSKY